MPKIFTDAEKARHKTRLFEEGMPLIARRGLKNVTVDELANLIGTSKGYFYILFESKGAFYLEGLMHKMNQNLSRLRSQAGAGASGEELLQIFSEMCLAQTVTDFNEIIYIYQTITSAQWAEFLQREEIHFREMLKVFGKEPSPHDVRTICNLTTAPYLLHTTDESTPYVFPDAKEDALKLLVQALLSFIRSLPDRKTSA